jgi:hypothetical protein
VTYSCKPIGRWRNQWTGVSIWHVMVQTAPAIANAIHDALGIRSNDLPLSTEKVYLALKERDG